MSYSPPIFIPSPPEGPSAVGVANPSTISKDATQGHAGEERQILSDLADKARASQTFGKEAGNPTPVRVSNQFIPPGIEIPQASGHPPPAPPPLRTVDGGEPDEDSGDEGLDDGLHSAPFLSGTRLSYQVSAARNNVAPTVPLNWKPTWSSAYETVPRQETNGLRSEVHTTTSLQEPKPFQGVGNDSYEYQSIEGLPQGFTPGMELSQNGYQNVSSTSGLTHTLAQTVQARLKHDLLGNSNQSALFRFLLDSIEKLEWMNIALNEKLAQQSTPAEQCAQPTADDLAADNLDSGSKTLAPTICMQTLHQVLCTNPWHGHNGALYADQPTFREVQARASNQRIKKLEGFKRINEVESYLKSRPEIAFVIFKSRVCEDQRVASKNWSRFQLGMCSCRSCVQNDLMERKQSFQLRTEQLRIISPQLKKALRGLGKCRMDGFVEGLEGDPHMCAPYLFLYHHRTEIADKLKEESEENDHLRLLKDWVDTNYGKEYDEADELFKKGIVSETHLEKLFKPNQVIIKKESNGHMAAYAAHWWPCWKDSGLTIQVWSWDFDGFDLKREPKQLSLTYDTHKDVAITDLQAYPMEYAPKEMLNTLLVRGKKFWSMRNGHFAGYSGLDSLREESYQGNRFMIDIKTHARMHSSSSRSYLTNTGCTITDSVEFDTWPTKIPASATIKDEVSMLLPYEVPGFEMESKKWVKLNIMQTERVSWNKKAFNRLVLDQQSKELIRALVSVHLGSKTTGDIIAGKGNGLIILLHGSPGVGKTLTAESVAELAEKPLYRVTCGDIGSKPDEVEKYLRMVLYLGKIWDCVLLMDEADVFLEERTMADLQRNSLVSVFLRTLESYDGILILTSNRVGTFDEAFKSRIQVALHYKPLNRKSRKQIWHNFFEMIGEQDDDVDVDEFESRLDELAAEELNGRQIRNCLQTAQQISKFKGEPLSWNSLSQALKTALDFQRYLKNIHGHNDETWAREERLR